MQRMASLSRRAKIGEWSSSSEKRTSPLEHSAQEVVEKIIDSLDEVCVKKATKALSRAESAQSEKQCRDYQGPLISPKDQDGGNVGYKSWICDGFDHGGRERQKVGRIRLEDSSKNWWRI